MSVESKRLSWNEHGDPTLTIVAVGTHDVYRLAHHLEHGQCEFAAIGRRVKAGMRRHLSKEGYAWLLRYMHGDGGFR